MFRTAMILGIAVLGAAAASPQAFAGPTEAVQKVSFFGEPFPYGYAGGGRCWHRIYVQTRYGVRRERVWVCR